MASTANRSGGARKTLNATETDEVDIVDAGRKGDGCLIWMLDVKQMMHKALEVSEKERDSRWAKSAEKR